MKKIPYIIAIILVVIIGFIYSKEKNRTKTPSSLTPISLAVDYTPNTNHTGVYVALAKGWYRDEGLDLTILPYSMNATPDLLVATGKADVGIGSTESVVSDAAVGSPVVSIAAIIAHNTSSLVALADSGIESPKDFENKIYGGYGMPYESAVVGEIIKKSGGNGKFKNITLELDQLEALKARKIDFTWIFDGWQGVEAAHKGIKLVTFPINANGIADYYTPVFIASPKKIQEDAALLKKFVDATRKGYEFAINHPEEAAEILVANTPEGTFPDTKFVTESQKYVSLKYGRQGYEGFIWGWQEAQKWHDYPKFMLDSGAIFNAIGKPVTTLDFESLYTNQFLKD